MPCAKENRVLGQGNLTAERNESMNEPTVAPIMGMNAYWFCLWVGELEMGTGHSPALQLAAVDSVSKQKKEKAVTNCQACQYWRKEEKEREDGRTKRNKEGQKESTTP